MMACTSNTLVQSKTLFVSDHLVDCEGVGPQSCMLVKETAEAEWTLFYGQIEGFNYEEGYTYEILVSETQIENPPADGSSIKYELKEIISKEKTLENSDLMKSWTVIKITGVDQLTTQPTFNFEEKDSKVSGFAGCNNYFSTYTIKANALSFAQIGATRKLCENMIVEDTFLKTLESVVRFEIVKKELHLFDINDELLIMAITE
jgi:heat shock protein HslJ